MTRKMQNEEKIFDILDGLASAEVIFQHKNLLKTSPEYTSFFKEMEALHYDLSMMNLEQPSAQFTDILLQNLGVATARKKSWAIKFAYIFAGIMFVFIIISIVLFGKNAPPVTSFAIKIVSFSELIFNVAFVRILLIINVLLLLLAIDRKVLKPFFEKKRMAL